MKATSKMPVVKDQHFTNSNKHPVVPNNGNLRCRFIRDNHGYGFKVTGNQPVKIQGVREGSEAWKAGLRENDVILKINGVDVTDLMHKDVVNLIRQNSSVDITVRSRSASPKQSSRGPITSPNRPSPPTNPGGLNSRLPVSKTSPNNSRPHAPSLGEFKKPLQPINNNNTALPTSSSTTTSRIPNQQQHIKLPSRPTGSARHSMVINKNTPTPITQPPLLKTTNTTAIMNPTIPEPEADTDVDADADSISSTDTSSSSTSTSSTSTRHHQLRPLSLPTQHNNNHYHRYSDNKQLINHSKDDLDNDVAGEMNTVDADTAITQPETAKSHSYNAPKTTKYSDDLEEDILQSVSAHASFTASNKSGDMQGHGMLDDMPDTVTPPSHSTQNSNFMQQSHAKLYSTMPYPKSNRQSRLNDQVNLRKADSTMDLPRYQGRSFDDNSEDDDSIIPGGGGPSKSGGIVLDSSVAGVSALLSTGGNINAKLMQILGNTESVLDNAGLISDILVISKTLKYDIHPLLFYYVCMYYKSQITLTNSITDIKRMSTEVISTFLLVKSPIIIPMPAEISKQVSHLLSLLCLEGGGPDDSYLIETANSLFHRISIYLKSGPIRMLLDNIISGIEINTIPSSDFKFARSSVYSQSSKSSSAAASNLDHPLNLLFKAYTNVVGLKHRSTTSIKDLSSAISTQDETTRAIQIAYATMYAWFVNTIKCHFSPSNASTTPGKSDSSAGLGGISFSKFRNSTSAMSSSIRNKSKSIDSLASLSKLPQPPPQTIAEQHKVPLLCTLASTATTTTSSSQSSFLFSRSFSKKASSSTSTNNSTVGSLMSTSIITKTTNSHVYRDCNQTPPYNAPPLFPVECSHCDKLLWGPAPPAITCMHCGIYLHRDCRKKYKVSCTKNSGNISRKSTISSVYERQMSSNSIASSIPATSIPIAGGLFNKLNRKSSHVSPTLTTSPDTVLTNGDASNALRNISFHQKQMINGPNPDPAASTDLPRSKSEEDFKSVATPSGNAEEPIQSTPPPSLPASIGVEVKDLINQDNLEGGDGPSSMDPDMKVEESFDAAHEMQLMFPDHYSELLQSGPSSTTTTTNDNSRKRLIVLLEFYHKTRYILMTMKQLQYALVDNWPMSQAALFRALSLQSIRPLVDLLKSFVSTIQLTVDSQDFTEMDQAVLTWLTEDHHNNLKQWMHLSAALVCTNSLNQVKGLRATLRSNPDLAQICQMRLNKTPLLDQLNQIRPLLISLPLIVKNVVKCLSKFYQLDSIDHELTEPLFPELNNWRLISSQMDLLCEYIDRCCVPLVDWTNGNCLLGGRIKAEQISQLTSHTLVEYCVEFPRTLFLHPLFDFQIAKVFQWSTSFKRSKSHTDSQQTSFLKKGTEVLMLVYPDFIAVLIKDNDHHFQLKPIKSQSQKNVTMDPILELNATSSTPNVTPSRKFFLTKGGLEDDRHVINILMSDDNFALLIRLGLPSETVVDNWLDYVNRSQHDLEHCNQLYKDNESLIKSLNLSLGGNNPNPGSNPAVRTNPPSRSISLKSTTSVTSVPASRSPLEKQSGPPSVPPPPVPLLPQDSISTQPTLLDTATGDTDHNQDHLSSQYDTCLDQFNNLHTILSAINDSASCPKKLDVLSCTTKYSNHVALQVLSCSKTMLDIAAATTLAIPPRSTPHADLQSQLRDVATRLNSIADSLMTHSTDNSDNNVEMARAIVEEIIDRAIDQLMSSPAAVVVVPQNQEEHPPPTHPPQRRLSYKYVPSACLIPDTDIPLSENDYYDTDTPRRHSCDSVVDEDAVFVESILPPPPPLLDDTMVVTRAHITLSNHRLPSARSG